MMSPGRLVCAVTLVLAGLVLNGCQRPSITVFAAASTIDAMTDVINEFQKRHPQATPIRINFAATSTLGILVMQGVQVDLFLAADADWSDRIREQRSGKEEVDAIDLLGNQLVLIAPAKSQISLERIERLEQIIELPLRRIAIGDPDSVPAGQYAKQHFQLARVWPAVQAKLVLGADVRQTLAHVVQGAADVGLVYASDIVGRDDVKVLLTLDQEAVKIVYQLLHFRSEQSTADSDALADFICGPEAATIFWKHGFQSITHPDANLDARTQDRSRQ